MSSSAAIPSEGIDPVRWRRLKDMVCDALEQPAGSSRITFLKEHCRDDDELLTEAISLVEETALPQTNLKESLEDCAERTGAIYWDPDPPLPSGWRVGAYVLLRELGRGGMGAVYLAARADGQFEKEVAIKVLKRGTDTDEVLRRFRIERQILADLEHPNITRLLDAGTTDDGLPYLVMELVNGTPITKYVQERKLTFKDRLQLFIKVCSAVEFAHGHGVIHRDIKPRNVLMTDTGEVKLLDFGIAKVVTGDDEENELTATAQRRFTSIYASPEQALGQPGTAASDVYSLGALLYELITGHRHPSGSDDAGDPGGGSLDNGIRRMVTRAMEHEPRDRYPSVAALAADAEEYLKGDNRVRANEENARRRRRWYATAGALILIVSLLAWLTSSGIRDHLRNRTATASATRSGETIRSIAILPFNQLPRDKDELLGFGMADAVIGRLSGLKQLVVLPTAAVSRFRGQAEDPIAAGKKLNVDAVLNGTVQQADGRIRVTVQLVNIASRRTLWAETIDHTSNDIFEIQDFISEKVARSLLVNLSEDERQRLWKNPTVDTAAYDFYLMGVAQYNTRTREGLARAIEYFQDAINKDPNYALSYALMADSYYLQGYYKYLPMAEAKPRAKSAAERAHALDKTLPEAYVAMAAVESSEDRNLRLLEQALELNPNLAVAQQRYAWKLCSRGRLSEAVAHMRRARDLDPLSPTNNTAFGVISGFARNFDDALSYCRRAVELNESESVLQENLAFADELNGMFQSAIDHYNRAAELSPENKIDYLAGIAAILFKSSRRAEAEKMIPEILKTAGQGKLGPYGVALLYTAQGNKDESFKWFERSLATRPANALDAWADFRFIRYDPRLDPLRKDPRFAELLHKYKLDTLAHSQE